MIKASKPGSFPLFQPEFIWVSAFSATILNASLRADSFLYLVPGQALFLNQQLYESVVTDGTILNFLHNRLTSNETADILCQKSSRTYAQSGNVLKCWAISLILSVATW